MHVGCSVLQLIAFSASVACKEGEEKTWARDDLGISNVQGSGIMH